MDLNQYSTACQNSKSNSTEFTFVSITKHISQAMHESIATISKTELFTDQKETDTYKYTWRVGHATVTQSLKLQSLNQPDKLSRILYLIIEYLDTKSESS
jgi:hypothetical protein